MRLRSPNRLILPPSTLQWQFNQVSSPIVSSNGTAHLTVSGSTFNGNSLTVDHTVASNYLQGPSGVLATQDKLTLFFVFKHDGTGGFVDLLMLGSGTGGTEADYGWYIDTNGGATGFVFGAATAFSYGTQVDVDWSAPIDDTKKHYLMAGYHKRAGGNRAFLYGWREGDSIGDFKTSTSTAMDDMNLDSAFRLLSHGGITGTEAASGITTYHHLNYWAYQYLEDKSLFQKLIETVKD